MAGERRKRPYVVERQESTTGNWARWDDTDYEGTAEALAAIRAGKPEGRFRIVCICAEFTVETETVVKVKVTEV